MWRYDSSATQSDDIFPTAATEGAWESIVAPARLLYLGDDELLEWNPSTGGFRLWHYDRGCNGMIRCRAVRLPPVPGSRSERVTSSCSAAATKSSVGFLRPIESMKSVRHMTFILAVLGLLAFGCKKTPEEAQAAWPTNEEANQKVEAKYPAFKPALEDLLTGARKDFEAGKPDADKMHAASARLTPAATMFAPYGEGIGPPRSADEGQDARRPSREQDQPRDGSRERRREEGGWPHEGLEAGQHGQGELKGRRRDQDARGHEAQAGRFGRFGQGHGGTREVGWKEVAAENLRSRRTRRDGARARRDSHLACTRSPG